MQRYVVQKNILAGFILLLFSAPVWAELEIIALKHRSAEEVLPSSGRLGEWLDVGGLGQQKSGDGSTISTRDASRTREQRSVLIRVEEVE